MSSIIHCLILCTGKIQIIVSFGLHIFASQCKSMAYAADTFHSFARANSNDALIQDEVLNESAF